MVEAALGELAGVGAFAEEDEAAGEGFADAADARASGFGKGAAEVVGEVGVGGRDGGGELLHAVHNADEDRDPGFFFDY